LKGTYENEKVISLLDSNLVNAEMVKAFIHSTEYRQRFAW